MPFELELPEPCKQAGWKVKIHDLERLEDPHVTIYRKRRMWRLSLRSNDFLDPGDKWSQIKREVKEAIVEALPILEAEWDRIHPDNPVVGEDDDGDIGQSGLH